MTECCSIKFWKYYYNVCLEGDYVVIGFFSQLPLYTVIEKSDERHLSLLLRYFHGERVDLSKIRVRVAAKSRLERLIWDVLRRIPYGETRSYKWVAENIGLPKAYRVVGRMLAKNPILVIIPCHRVIRSDGSLGGYTSIGGVELKRKLLELEGVSIE